MRPTAVRIVCAAVLALGLWYTLYRSIPTSAPATGDEVNWLVAGDITYRLVRNGAGPEAWKKAYPSLGSFGNLNPPLGKLAFGASLARVKDVDERLRYRWHWADKDARNLRYENRVPLAHAQAAREASALFGGLSLALLIALAYQITGNFWAALIAPLTLMWSYAFRYSSTHIFTDAPQIAYMLAGMVAFQHHLKSRSWLSLGAAGLLMGASVAVKYSSAPVLLVLGLFALFSPGTALQRFGRAALVTLVSVGVFVAVNPYLYPDPLGRSLDIISEWAPMMDRIAHRPQRANVHVETWQAGLATVTRRGITHPNLSAPLPYAGIGAALLGAAAAGCGLWRHRVRRRDKWRTPATLTGLALGAVGLLGFAFGLLGAWAWLYLVGANALLWKVAKGVPDSSRRLVCAFFVSCIFIVWLSNGLWLHIDWPRYSLRVLVLTPCVLAAGVAALAEIFQLERRHESSA